MLLLLLASTFALSFTPLIQNDDLRVALSAGTVDLTDYKVTFTATITDTPVVQATYKYYLFDALTDGDKIDEVAFELTETGTDSIELLPLAETLNGHKKFFIDVYIEKAGETATSVLTGSRLEVAFAAKATSVEAVQTSATEATITFTLDAALAPDLKDTTFVGIEAGLPVKKVGTEGHIYKVETTIAAIVAATPPYGYFKGTAKTDSTLPIWFPNKAAPVLTLTHKDETKVKAVVSELADHDAYILFEGETDPVKLVAKQGETEITLTYADLAKDAVVYYTKKVTPPVVEDTEANADEEPVIVSIKGLLSQKRIEATLKWIAPTPPAEELSNDTPDEPVDEVDNTPLLQATFKEAMETKVVTLYLDDKAGVDKTIPATKIITFEPEEIAGGVALLLHKIAADAPVEFLPLALPNATFKLSNGTATDKVQPVLVEMEKAGIYEVKPAGIVVVKNGTEDCSTGKYYPLVWSTTATDVGKATADVKIADWTSVKDKNVIAFVTSKHEPEAIPKKPVRLSADFAVFKRETDPVTPPASAFTSVASLMAALLSLIVLAF